MVGIGIFNVEVVSGIDGFFYSYFWGNLFHAGYLDQILGKFIKGGFDQTIIQIIFAFEIKVDRSLGYFGCYSNVFNGSGYESFLVKKGGGAILDLFNAVFFFSVFSFADTHESVESPLKNAETILNVIIK
jgi:hypothetical protein